MLFGLSVLCETDYSMCLWVRLQNHARAWFQGLVLEGHLPHRRGAMSDEHPVHLASAVLLTLLFLWEDAATGTTWLTSEHL